jgi:hypothetical protein
VIRNKSIARRIGFWLALLHITAFGALFFVIKKSVDPQAPMLWSIFLVLDFPLSLLYFIAPFFHLLRVQVGEESWIGQFLYLPYLIDGGLGTVWWYFLPRFVMPRRLGGVWKQKDSRIEQHNV